VSSEPIRQPANDLVAFDISRQSPEQIAKMFARWKERRAQQEPQETQRTSWPQHLRPVPSVVPPEADEAPEPPEQAASPA